MSRSIQAVMAMPVEVAVTLTPEEFLAQFDAEWARIRLQLVVELEVEKSKVGLA